MNTIPTALQIIMGIGNKWTIPISPIRNTINASPEAYPPMKRHDNLPLTGVINSHHLNNSGKIPPHRNPQPIYTDRITKILRGNNTKTLKKRFVPRKATVRLLYKSPVQICLISSHRYCHQNYIVIKLGTCTLCKCM